MSNTDKLARIAEKLHNNEYGALGAASAVFHDLVSALSGGGLAEEAQSEADQAANAARAEQLRQELAQLEQK